MNREKAAKIERTDKSVTITHKDGTVTHGKLAPPGYMEAILEGQKRDAEERAKLKEERQHRQILEDLERNFPGF